MNVIGIIQARMSSTRLPGKVLKPILGKPMIVHQLERVRRVKSVDHWIVATSTDPSDDPIAELIADVMADPSQYFDQSVINGRSDTSSNHSFQKAPVDSPVVCYRGSLNDVLDRFSEIVHHYPCNHVVRLTGDCPLSDPEIIEAIVQQHLTTDSDYTSNIIQPTLPDGLDVEVVRTSALLHANEQAKLPSEREHVTPYVRYRDDIHTISDYIYPTDYSNIRLTVDYNEDFKLINHIFKALYPMNKTFGVEEVMKLLSENQSWLKWNSVIDRDEGYSKSIDSDYQYLRALKLKQAQ